MVEDNMGASGFKWDDSDGDMRRGQEGEAQLPGCREAQVAHAWAWL